MIRSVDTHTSPWQQLSLLPIMGSVLLIAGALSRNVNVGKEIVPTITLLAKVDNTKGTKTLNPRKTKL